MNEQLRKAVHTAWTEPRHFFFWLALLSLCGLGAVAAATGLSTPSVPLAFVALACGLGFVMSLAAFVLAWVPPARSVLAWLLGRRFLVLGFLVTLVVLFYAIEDWRGRKAWGSFKHQREAHGQRLEFASLAPPPVADDQNFFETPLWTDLRFTRTNETVIWGDTNRGSHAIFDVFGPHGGNAPGTGNWTKMQRVDLAAWQAFYRGTNNLFAAQGGPATNYFPMAAAPQSPAADVLLALSRFQANRRLLIAAASRPEARFWIDYDAGAAMLLPHLSRIKATAQYPVAARERRAQGRRQTGRPRRSRAPVSAAGFHPRRTHPHLPPGSRGRPANRPATRLGGPGGPAVE